MDALDGIQCAKVVVLKSQRSEIMAAPSCVFTIARVAIMLDEDEAWLEEIALEMEPEDGCLRICDVDDDISVTAFTPFGLERLKELIDIHKGLRPLGRTK